MALSQSTKRNFAIAALVFIVVGALALIAAVIAITAGSSAASTPLFIAGAIAVGIGIVLTFVSDGGFRLIFSNY
jgi:putative flippase GtrA